MNTSMTDRERKTGSEPVDLPKYLTRGVETIVGEALRATLRDPREGLFMARFARAAGKASERRDRWEREGLHVPSYLIASITSSCNLHCAGCYSRANHATEDGVPARQLTAAQWEDIFRQAEALGISFLLLAGGEPLLRYDVLEAAGRHPSLLFPVFTNGTFLGEAHLRLLDRCRNLIPVISIEGDRRRTDARRGEGVYGSVVGHMEQLRKRGILFGCSVTVTTENLDEVLSDAFADTLSGWGCKAVFYIEFVPVTEETRRLAPGDAERARIRAGIDRLRGAFPDLVLISFPGDEKSSGGCLAAGRGFFHINAHGGAEPCPFSPYSDINVAETSLKEALRSGLFRALRDNGHLLEDHAGGCVLFEKRALVEELARRAK